jgi:hypothetical protein
LVGRSEKQITKAASRVYRMNPSGDGSAIGRHHSGPQGAPRKKGSSGTTCRQWHQPPELCARLPVKIQCCRFDGPTVATGNSGKQIEELVVIRRQSA